MAILRFSNGVEKIVVDGILSYENSMKNGWTSSETPTVSHLLSNGYLLQQGCNKQRIIMKLLNGLKKTDAVPVKKN